MLTKLKLLCNRVILAEKHLLGTLLAVLLKHYMSLDIDLGSKNVYLPWWAVCKSTDWSYCAIAACHVIVDPHCQCMRLTFTWRIGGGFALVMEQSHQVERNPLAQVLHVLLFCHLVTTLFFCKVSDNTGYLCKHASCWHTTTSTSYCLLVAYRLCTYAVSHFE